MGVQAKPPYFPIPQVRGPDIAENAVLADHDHLALATLREAWWSWTALLDFFMTAEGFCSSRCLDVFLSTEDTQRSGWGSYMVSSQPTPRGMTGRESLGSGYVCMCMRIGTCTSHSVRTDPSTMWNRRPPKVIPI